MLKKKSVLLVTAAITAAVVMAGVAYAWFTSAKTTATAAITAGMLEIEFVLDQDEEGYPLYPQETGSENGKAYPIIVAGTGYPDVAQKSYTLTNLSDRHALVKIDAVTLTSGGVIGCVVDEDGYVVYDTAGDFTPFVITKPDAVMFYYDVESDDDDVAVATIGNNGYIYLPEGAEANLILNVWLDGEKAGNEYQHATITFDGLSAMAAQYRAAAIESTFGLDGDARDIILAETGVAFE